MTFNTEYYSTLDRGYYHTSPKDPLLEPSPVEFPEQSKSTTTLTAREIGSSEADIGQGTPLQHIQAAIRQGTAKVEFTFFGTGKSGQGQHTPESVGRLEREQLKEITKLNDIKLTTHASVGIQGASGLTREGFDEQARSQSLREINKAIEFAGEATTGGAVVFHTGEWQRSLTDIKGGNFKGYPREEATSPVQVVDRNTGDIVGIKKDQSVFEPVFHTAKTYQKETGRQLVGTRDKYGNVIEANDWVDVNGNAIKKEWLLSKKSEETERLFDRVPVWNPEKTNFQVQERNFSDFVNEAKELKQKGVDITPEVLFVKTQYSNQVLQAKGQSLYHAQRYEDYRKRRDAAQKALERVEKLEKTTPKEDRWRLLEQVSYAIHQNTAKFFTNEDKMPSDLLKEEIKEMTDQMRYIHESSSSADSQAKQALERMNRVVTLEDYGLKKSAETIAAAGMNAMYVSNKHKKDLKDPIYIAPESFMPQMYGSHPDEIRRIIVESRKEMSRVLQTKGYTEHDAQEKAKQHIKATLDTGHFNQWRKYWEAKPGENPDQAEKRFEKWYLNESEKLAKEGIIGHIHLTDNFGYDDEHLTPGHGNAPIKEFMKIMEKHGIRDFIVERGGSNPTAHMDTLADFGSPVYALGRRFTFNQVRGGHFGYAAPANYIVGAYAPSNEWRLWSEVPLE